MEHLEVDISYQYCGLGLTSLYAQAETLNQRRMYQPASLLLGRTTSMTISRNGCFQKQINVYTKEDSVLLFRQGEEGEGFCVTLLGLVALFT